MLEFTHEDVLVRYHDDVAAVLPVSALLHNKMTFHVQVSPNMRGELFSLCSLTYETQLIVEDGFVILRRNNYEARKKIGKVERHYQILVSWKPDLFALALMIDDNVGGEDACVTINTRPIYIPIELLNWARQFNLLPRSTYNTPAEFSSVFIESLHHTARKIRNANSVNIFWDRQKNKRAINRLVPKREPEAMRAIAALLQDQAMLGGYELVQESSAGSGIVDLRAVGKLVDGRTINICVEGKNAHSDDLLHGITDQLPAYMQSVGADFGVYLVLWYQCDAFPKPAGKSETCIMPLIRARPLKTIAVERFDLSLPISPSKKEFEFA